MYMKLTISRPNENEKKKLRNAQRTDSSYEEGKRVKEKRSSIEKIVEKHMKKLVTNSSLTSANISSLADMNKKGGGKVVILAPLNAIVASQGTNVNSTTLAPNPSLRNTSSTNNVNS